ncbi:MAG: PIN domain-containing protein [Terriglobia bacterium]
MAFDSSFLTLIFNRQAKASVANAAELVDDLIKFLAEETAKIIIPTPVLTEVLIKARDAGPTYLEKLKPYACFQIRPFDEKSAVELAETLVASIGKIRTKREVSQTKITLDRQIVATAKAHSATEMYSDDKELRSFAQESGLDAFGFSDLKVSPKQTKLFQEPREQARHNDLAEGSDAKTEK